MNTCHMKPGVPQLKKCILCHKLNVLKISNYGICVYFIKYVQEINKHYVNWYLVWAEGILLILQLFCHIIMQ